MTIDTNTRLYIEKSLTQHFGSQTRKDKITPAVTHSIAVGQMLTLLECSPLTIAGGYGHDLIEDVILQVLGCDPHTATELEMHDAYAEAREMLYGYILGWAPVHDMTALCTIIDSCTYQPEHYLAQRSHQSDYDGKVARKILAGRLWTDGITEVRLPHNSLTILQSVETRLDVNNRATREIKLVDAMHNETTSTIDPAFRSCFMRSTMPIATSLATRIKSDGTKAGHSARMVAFAQTVLDRFAEAYPPAITPDTPDPETGLSVPGFLRRPATEKPFARIDNLKKKEVAP